MTAVEGGKKAVEAAKQARYGLADMELPRDPTMATVGGGGDEQLVRAVVRWKMNSAVAK